MDTLSLIVSLLVIVLCGLLLWALMTHRTNATGIWAQVVRVTDAVDSWPVSGAILALLRREQFVALLVAFIVYLSAVVNPQLLGVRDQLFPAIFGTWLVVSGMISVSDYQQAKYDASNPASSLSDASRQMFKALITEVLQDLGVDGTTVNVNATPATSANSAPLSGTVVVKGG